MKSNYNLMKTTKNRGRKQTENCASEIHVWKSRYCFEQFYKGFCLFYSNLFRKYAYCSPKEIRETKWETNQLSCTIVFFLHKLDSQYTTSTPKYTYKYQPIDKYVNLCVYVLNVPKDIIDFESGKSFMCS